VACAHARDVLDELGLAGRIDLFQVRVPYPLHAEFVRRVRAGYDRVLVLEETYPVIELQLRDDQVAGKASGAVPAEGELTPDVLREALLAFLGRPAAPAPAATRAAGARPTLCAGCGHRAAFHAIRATFPDGIFPGDIGCYTLGVNLGAVDTCHCMGAGISQAAGFYHAHAQDGGRWPTIVATIGDSTFFHSGIPALVNAVTQRARIIVVILDNGTTAMTGHQPTPAVPASPRVPVRIPEVVRGSGVGFLREVDPLHVPDFTAALRDADRYCRSDDGGPAVIVATHPCVLQARPEVAAAALPRVTEGCTGCRICLSLECPAILWDDDAEAARIDRTCTACGLCLHICPVDAIVAGVPGAR
jgi:indolepyruvate ferredoxin oxidoreductase alpha subunit